MTAPVPLYSTNAAWLAALKLWLMADDTPDVQIQTWLYLAQLRLNRELQSVHMEATIDIPIDDTLKGKPLDIATLIPTFNKVRLVIPFLNAKSAYSVSINEMIDMIGEAVASGSMPTPIDQKSYFCIDTNLLYIFPWPLSGSTVTVKYYPIIPPISATVDTNVFGDWHSDLLLFASLIEGSKFIVEDDRLPTWKTAYAEGVESTNNTSKHQKLGSTPLVRQIWASPGRKGV